MECMVWIGCSALVVCLEKWFQWWHGEEGGGHEIQMVHDMINTIPSRVGQHVAIGTAAEAVQPPGPRPNGRAFLTRGLFVRDRHREELGRPLKKGTVFRARKPAFPCGAAVWSKTQSRGRNLADIHWVAATRAATVRLRLNDRTPHLLQFQWADDLRVQQPAPRQVARLLLDRMLDPPILHCRHTARPHRCCWPRRPSRPLVLGRCGCIAHPRRRVHLGSAVGPS